MRALQAAAAISMDAFVANLTPLDPLADHYRPQPGQQQAAEELRNWLVGSAIIDPTNARRLQDPLSIRNVAQVHGAAFAALEFSDNAAVSEINGASDNPVVDIKQGRIISCGAYHTPLLSVAAQTLSNALMHVSHTQLARVACLLKHRFTGLPQYLAAPGADSNGFAPILKVMESLVAEIGHAAAQVAVWPSVNADGAEDIQTHSAVAIKALGRVVVLAEKLCAVEMIVAAQAFEMRRAECPAPRIAELVSRIRALSPSIDRDRPLGAEIEKLAAVIAAGELVPPMS
jgi:histidine ammonia-lyase